MKFSNCSRKSQGVFVSKWLTWSTARQQPWTKNLSLWKRCSCDATPSPNKLTPQTIPYLLSSYRFRWTRWSAAGRSCWKGCMETRIRCKNLSISSEGKSMHNSGSSRKTNLKQVKRKRIRTSGITKKMMTAIMRGSLCPIMRPRLYIKYIRYCQVNNILWVEMLHNISPPFTYNIDRSKNQRLCFRSQ